MVIDATSPATLPSSTTSDEAPAIIDLFAGVGGLTLGAISAGFRVALAVERDQHAIAAHKLNFPGLNHSDQDISTIDGASLLTAAGLTTSTLGGIIGGPPCQGFSTMGHRSVVDQRNNLFVKFFELVKECRPKFFVAENVMGILDSAYDSVRKTALDIVRSDYIILDPMPITASDFGAPTVRKRVFFVGYRIDAIASLSEKDFLLKKTNATPTVSEALFGLPTRIRGNWIEESQGWRKAKAPLKRIFAQHITNEVAGVGDIESLKRYRENGLVSGCLGTRHSDELRIRYGSLKPGEQDQITKSVRLRQDGLCPTLRAGTGADRGSFQAVRPIHPTVARVITPREAARLQGFPDWFRFAPSKWHSFRQIGNSVSPIVASAILSVIRSKISPPHGKQKQNISDQKERR